MFLAPVLRPVENAADLHRAVRHAVNHDVGQGKEDELAPSRHPAAGKSNLREVFEALASAVDNLRHAPLGVGVVALNPTANTLKVIRCRY
jgi:hypothetical protein